MRKNEEGEIGSEDADERKLRGKKSEEKEEWEKG